MKLWILVGCYQGVVDDIAVCKTPEKAEEAFKRWTDGIDYKDNPCAENTDYDQTQIFEVDLDKVLNP